MAEDRDQDLESRTEEPSDRRRREFAERGETAVSPDVVAGLAFLAAGGALFATIPRTGHALVAFGAAAWTSAGRVAGPEELVGAVLPAAGRALSFAVVPVVFGALAGGILASIAQGAGAFHPQITFPNGERLDPVAGFGRSFSRRAAVEALLSTAKFMIVGAVACGAALAVVRLTSSGATSPAEIARKLGEALRQVALRGGAALVLLGVADHLKRRRDLDARMRMTREEAQREHKEEEGDPANRRRRRDFARRLLRSKPPAQAMKLATVVITNPTHFAVVLRYKAGETRAPRVLAKGAGALAKAIREAAADAGVPLVENPPLARAIYRSVRVGGEIPPALYEAVARVLAYLHRLARQRAGAG